MVNRHFVTHFCYQELLQTTNHNILLTNSLTNVSVVNRCLLGNTTTRLRAQICLNKCSKCPTSFPTSKKTLSPLAHGCVDDTLINSFSDCNKTFMQFVDGLPQFSDKIFTAGLTIYLPTHVQNFIEISRNLAML